MAKTKRPSPPQTPDPSAQLDLRPGQSTELLQALNILTREGKINQDSRRKLKQVNHLCQFLEKPLHAMLQAREAAGDTSPLTLADHGAGKSYLGFMLHDVFVKPQSALHQRNVAQVWGIETRAELVASSQALAQKMACADSMHFAHLSVQESMQDACLPKRFDMVTALHACDTATDDAIAFGLAKQAGFMALVPCCQAELARSLNHHKALNLQRTPLAELWRHPLHTREMGSQLTNVLRCLYLESQGYKVTV
ncbi:MAG: SAM-dependent methyltransferase, partial [Betaproteobacteria bacterium]|nr:SAM-dependent methyltransferase [Betaproteobacteria bacterium]